MSEHTEVDFSTWGQGTLARLAAELHKENKRLSTLNIDLQQANLQLQSDLKDAMAELRKTIKDQETIDELFDLHAGAHDGRLSKVDAPAFLKSVLS
jgi:hypothetical protein